MGFLERFKRDRARNKPSFPPVRLHHHSMAHGVLRDLALKDPVPFLVFMGAPDPSRYISKLWELNCKWCDDSAARPAFGAADFSVHTGEINNCPYALVELPAPIAATEAYFVALALSVPIEAIENNTAPARYFTLEYSPLCNANPPMVLGEWTAEGTHLNHGAGPRPTREAFLEALAALHRAASPDHGKPA